jgi:hypothetical protein
VTDLWDKDADHSELEPHYSNAVDILTRHQVFAKSECAAVIALHVQEIGRLREAIREHRRCAKDGLDRSWWNDALWAVLD